MGRVLSELPGSLNLNKAITANPITGTFGQGKVKFFFQNGVFTVPSGVNSVRARVWGAGVGPGGAGGGFALKEITGLTPGDTVTITVGQTSTTLAGTSSFGAYVSATGANTVTPGNGVGGDINYSGGSGTASGAGGGAGSLMGNGGVGGGVGQNGGSGGGSSGGSSGGNGFTGVGGVPSTGFYNGEVGDLSSLDYIGTGGGGASSGNGANGGGGGTGGKGGFPGGGGGANSGSLGANGLVIVEW